MTLAFHPSFGFDEKILELSKKALLLAEEEFDRIGAAVSYNSQKVLAAFIKNRVSETHFAATTGYGYNDRGREVLDAVYADVMGAEAALVRHFMLSGTHALTVGLFGVLRPGDVMLSATGAPYDTLSEVIGTRGEGGGSLAEFGIKYREIQLDSLGGIDYAALEKALSEKPKLVYIQRSRGYSMRPSVSLAEIEKTAALTHRISPDSIVFVDNCYGEFIEEREPPQAGADLIAGSLIKNAGGTLAPCGGYIAGKKELVQKCACRLTSPGLGGEIGASLGQNSFMFRGIYEAPAKVGEALKTAVFAAAVYGLLGFECSPGVKERRTDIVQQIVLKSPRALKLFCEAIQAASPVDSFVCPEEWDMPGYDSKVIMAAGTFVSGASAELSADAPMRPPYTVYMQGAIGFETAAAAVLNTVKKLREAGIITL